MFTRNRPDPLHTLWSKAKDIKAAWGVLVWLAGGFGLVLSGLVWIFAGSDFLQALAAMVVIFVAIIFFMTFYGWSRGWGKSLTPFRQLYSPGEDADQLRLPLGGEHDEQRRLAAEQAAVRLDRFVRARFFPAFDQLVKVLDNAMASLDLLNEIEEFCRRLLTQHVDLAYNTKKRDFINKPGLSSHADQLELMVHEFGEMYDDYCRSVNYLRRLCEITKTPLENIKDYEQWRSYNAKLLDGIHDVLTSPEYRHLHQHIDHANNWIGYPT